MSEVRTVAVIGAGIMGRGIAHAAALGGYRTILEDLLPNALRKAETEFCATLDEAVELGKVNAADANAAFSRIEYAGSVHELRARPISSSKRFPRRWNRSIQIFTMLDNNLLDRQRFLSSNTSSLKIIEIATVTFRAQKRIGMTF